jgi:hypothetical protein
MGIWHKPLGDLQHTVGFILATFSSEWHSNWLLNDTLKE